MVTEENFDEMGVSFYQASRQSVNYSSSLLVNSEHQVMKMVESLTVLEKSFNS